MVALLFEALYGAYESYAMMKIKVLRFDFKGQQVSSFRHDTKHFCEKVQKVSPLP